MALLVNFGYFKSVRRVLFDLSRVASEHTSLLDGYSVHSEARALLVIL